MSEERNDQQAVIENADEQAAPASEGADAQGSEDLDAILAEYDETESASSQSADANTGVKAESQSEQKPDTGHDLQELKKRLEEQEKREADRVFRQDMQKAVQSVRGDMDAEQFDDLFIEAWIDRQAREDPRLARAWQQRHENPKQFERVLDGLGQSFSKKFTSMTDKQATEDREAVTAAVRGASTKAPEPKEPDYSTMSDSEFREKMEKDHGFSPLI